MKKFIFTAFLFCLIGTLGANAQKFAFIDTELILSQIDEFKANEDKIEQQAKVYQAEVQKMGEEVEKLYKNLQENAKKLSEAQLEKQQAEIQKKEAAVMEQGRKYFGPEGAIAQMKEKLLNPFYDKIYEASKQVAIQYDYAAIIDRATASSVIFAQPKHDISNEILSVMGYSK
ncbi:OmpH family outer membrane protein [Bacteroides propionicifaciens]|uniref:OmpH family outer membrane protein n=1 Tax=Bacteroides propionicifaciens TaxID=392838 RepID=UPI00037B7680|nr:OmpH family outer membrane protein [Bacteroides propionicifaciens]